MIKVRRRRDKRKIKNAAASLFRGAQLMSGGSRGAGEGAFLMSNSNKIRATAVEFKGAYDLYLLLNLQITLAVRGILN